MPIIDGKLYHPFEFPPPMTVEEIGRSARVKIATVIKTAINCGVLVDNKTTVVEPICARTLLSLLRADKRKQYKKKGGKK